MKIKDLVYGDELNLLKDRLEETDGHESVYPYHVLFEDLKAAIKEKARTIVVYGRDMSGRSNPVDVRFSSKERVIGCRTFSPATFAKILKAAGVKPATKRRKK